MLIALGGLPGAGKSALASAHREHRRRVESRIADIPGLVLPTWRQVLERRYEPWKTAHVIDTAGRRLEDTVSQAEACAMAASTTSRG